MQCLVLDPPADSAPKAKQESCLSGLALRGVCVRVWVASEAFMQYVQGRRERLENVGAVH